MSDLFVDVSSRVSPELSAVIESLVNNPDAIQPVTLPSVRSYISQGLPEEIRELYRLHFDGDQTLLSEVDALIEEYGADAPAFDFVEISASEPLSRVIEAVVNDENRENPPTLETVREEMSKGLMARLVGEGVMEDDEDDSLLVEIDELIERFGPDMLAEGFLRYE